MPTPPALPARRSESFGAAPTLLGALLALLCAPACGRAPDGQGARNLILISVDTLRADHLGCYGYDRPTSPVLDAFAAEGALFEEASSPASWTVPAHMSMLTGQYARTHGIDGWKKTLPAETQTLASYLKGEGFATAAYVNVVLLNELRSFNRGFDEYHIVPKAESAMGATKRILDGAIPWIEARGEDPFFLFLHFYDVHSDYDPLPEYRRDFVRMYNGDVTGETSQLRSYRKGGRAAPWGPSDARHLIDLYDAGIRQFDDQIQQLFDFLRGSAVGPETLVVLTSDHGEEFLEHGGVMHGRTLHQELLHVPLILHGPGVPAGVRIAGNASLVDLMPTALSLLGLEAPAQCEGLDLSGTWRSSTDLDDRLVFAEADKWLAQQPGNYRRAIRKGDFKLLYDHTTGARVVYDLAADPTEQQGLAGDDSGPLAKVLWQDLQAFMQGKREVAETLDLTDEEKQELEDLGYF